MTAKAHTRNKHRVTVFFKSGVEVSRAPASRTDKDWNSKTQSYIRVPATAPKRARS